MTWHLDTCVNWCPLESHPDKREDIQLPVDIRNVTSKYFQKILITKLFEVNFTDK